MLLKISLFIFVLLHNSVHAQFQGSTEVLQTFSGPGANYGWAVSELSDIDQDGVTDIIIGATGSARTDVYSGKSGNLIYSFSLANSQLGYAVADAGDVNGDGVNDIVSGGPTHNNSTGIAWVHSGANGEILWTFNGEQSGDRFGTAVSSGGDINQDGFVDILIGAENNNHQGTNSGRAYIYSGKDGSLLRTLESESPGDKFGSGTALLGDLNSDGIQEHIIGAYNAETKGKAYVFSGTDGELLFDLSADSGGRRFGQFFVANSGDVDNDGIEDIYVGDFSHGSGAGQAYVFSGRNQEVLYRFAGGFGDGVGPGRGAGDVNNDGHADILVGFYTHSSNQAGKAVIYSGKDGSELQSIVHDIAQAQLGFDAVGIGDVNGDDKDDFLISAANDSKVYVIAGETQKLPDPYIAINDGMSGTWYNRQTPGQGFLLDVNTDMPLIFGGWFTHKPNSDKARSNKQIGDENHMWLSLQGEFEGDTATLALSTTENGIFDDPAEVNSSVIGTIEFRFYDCSRGKANYEFELFGQAFTHEIEIHRLVPDSFCESSLETRNIKKTKGEVHFVNAGLTGTWLNRDTRGQGILMTVNQEIDLFFAGWFTYDTQVEGGQRWFSLQGPLSDSNSISASIFSISHGVFDNDQEIQSQVVGQVNITFNSCTEALFSYVMTEGEELSGEFLIHRLTPDVFCNTLISEH